jgi:hypothetical protein
VLEPHGLVSDGLYRVLSEVGDLLGQYFALRLVGDAYSILGGGTQLN